LLPPRVPKFLLPLVRAFLLQQFPGSLPLFPLEPLFACLRMALSPISEFFCLRFSWFFMATGSSASGFLQSFGLCPGLADHRAQLFLLSSWPPFKGRHPANHPPSCKKRLNAPTSSAVTFSLPRRLLYTYPHPQSLSVYLFTLPCEFFPSVHLFNVHRGRGA